MTNVTPKIMTSKLQGSLWLKIILNNVTHTFTPITTALSSILQCDSLHSKNKLLKTNNKLFSSNNSITWITIPEITIHRFASVSMVFKFKHFWYFFPFICVSKWTTMMSKVC
ncbi:hypothetical protein GQR58_014581 [Nymphon striatum]|nr:hypothetical protein GQR58_014581 [Nymphon striatum]